MINILLQKEQIGYFSSNSMQIHKCTLVFVYTDIIYLQLFLKIEPEIFRITNVKLK